VPLRVGAIERELLDVAGVQGAHGLKARDAIGLDAHVDRLLRIEVAHRVERTRFARRDDDRRGLERRAVKGGSSGRCRLGGGCRCRAIRLRNA